MYHVFLYAYAVAGEGGGELVKLVEQLYSSVPSITF